MNDVTPPQWPDDADGDVFRSLANEGFDFDARHRIDFILELELWPPSPGMFTLLASQYSEVQAEAPARGERGFIRFSVDGRLSYELVRSIQRSVSDLASAWGGVCESWGVLHG